LRLTKIAAAYQAEGDFDRRAIVDFDKAIQMNLNDADSYNNRGVASALGVPCTFAPSLPRLRPNSARSQPLLGRSIQTFNLQGGCHAYDADSHIQVQDNAHVRQSITLPYCALLSNNSTA
jgi:hypothetical protein